MVRAREVDTGPESRDTVTVSALYFERYRHCDLNQARHLVVTYVRSKSGSRKTGSNIICASDLLPILIFPLLSTTPRSATKLACNNFRSQPLLTVNKPTMNITFEDYACGCEAAELYLSQVMISFWQRCVDG